MKLKLTIIFSVVVAILAFYFLIRSTSHKVNMLLVNGTVYTLDQKSSVVQAVAIREDRIIGVGSAEELQNRYKADTVIDLKGKTVFPGFIDAHAHMAGLGQLMQSVILVGVPSPEEAADAVRERALSVPAGQWIYGRGWDQNLWEGKQFPTAALLDAAAPSNPVILVRIDGHAIWVNSKAMELAKIIRETKDPEGGKIIRDSKGNPTGVFVDNARELIESVVPPVTPAEIERNILTAASECSKMGLTEVGDMGVDSLDISIYKRLVDEHKLPIRIYGAIIAPSPTWTQWSNHEPMIGYGNGMLTVRAMKLYVDGALGSRGAALVEEYSDDPGNRGLTMISENDLETNVRLAVQHGYQPCIHAIGDRGNHIALDVYENVLKSSPKGDYRMRIEHAQVILPEDIPRFKHLDVLPSMQPIHATSDMPWAEARLGSHRIKGAYAWRSLLKTGTIIPGGSDFPNDGMNPLWGFYAAITRSDRTGSPQNGWYGEQKMFREEAARCFTQWAAYAAYEENVKGTIEVGKWADITVLSKDIMKIPPMDILSTDVEMTIVGGKVIFQKSVVTP